LVWIQQLYDLEDRAREFSVDERQALRQEEAVPVLERMKARFPEVRLHLHRIASGMPVWPMDTRILGQFVGVVAIPLIIGLFIEFFRTWIF
jgi:hypothetical protein